MSTAVSVVEQTATPRLVVRKLWKLGWPLGLMLQLVGYSDAVVMFWLGHMLGPAGLAVEATMRHLFMAAGWLIGSVGTGVSVLVSQSVGARDGKALTIVASGVRLCLVMSAVTAAIVVVCNGPIVDVLGSRDIAPSDLRAYMLPWVVLTLPSIGVLLVLLGGSSGAGWTQLTLQRAAADLALTTVVVPLFVGVLGLGVGGAPLAVGLVQLAMAALVWRAMRRRRETWHLGALPERGSHRELWRPLLDIGLPPQLARLAMLGAYAYLAQHVAQEGEAQVAAYGISVMLMFVGFNLTAAIGRACGILVGQLVGAKAWDRVPMVVRVALTFSLCLSVGPVLLLMLGGGPIASLFVDQALVIDSARDTLRVIAWALPFTAISQLYLFVLTAIKASKVAGLLGIVADGVGLAFALLWPGPPLEVAAWSIVLSNATRAVLFFGLWRIKLPK
ncbi:MAG: MATE family efflux transporter [Kofleriaceae bacterium]